MLRELATYFSSFMYKWQHNRSDMRRGQPRRLVTASGSAPSPLPFAAQAVGGQLHVSIGGEEKNDRRRSRLGAIVCDGVRLFAVDRFDNAALGGAFGHFGDDGFAHAAHAHPYRPSGFVRGAKTPRPVCPRWGRRLAQEPRSPRPARRARRIRARDCPRHGGPGAHWLASRVRLAAFDRRSADRLRRSGAGNGPSASTDPSGSRRRGRSHSAQGPCRFRRSRSSVRPGSGPANSLLFAGRSSPRLATARPHARNRPRCNPERALGGSSPRKRRP